MIRILTLSRLYPNSEMPSNGVFVENRLRRLVATGEISAHVVAATSWFPFRSRRFGIWSAWARIPAQEQRFGIEISHPAWLSIPRIGLAFAALPLAFAQLRHVRRLMREGYVFDLVDAHYFYPDGLAAVLVARRLGLPVVVSARGSDLFGYAEESSWLRRWIGWALRRVDHTIAVSEALRKQAIDLGASADRVTTLRNGVDLELFAPRDREAARERLAVEGPILLSVARLGPRKGADVAIKALAGLPGATLLLAGEGPEKAALETLARHRGVADRVRFLGEVPHAELPWLYSAADVLVLASASEGWPNVLLESLACGTPVVATKVGGIPEIVRANEAGLLVAERTGAAFARAIGSLLASPPPPSAVRAYAERFGWEEVVTAQAGLYRRICARHRGAPLETESPQDVS